MLNLGKRWKLMFVSQAKRTKLIIVKKENNVKPKPFHLLINVSHYIFLPVFILLILNVNAYADKREVRVGVYANKPLVYQDENGEHKGLSIDVLRFVASKENWKLEFVPCSWSECLEMVKRGENDIQVIIAETPERAKIYDFTSQSLYSLWAQIFIHPDSDIESWTDLKGKNVAVYKDDLFSGTFKKLIREFGIDCNLLEVESYQAMLKLIKEKKADAGVFIQTFAEPYAIRGIVRRTPIMFNPVPIYYAFPKGKVPELVTAIDRHLKTLKEDKDSIYYHSLDKIFVKERELTIPLWLKWILIVAPSLVLLSLIGSVILRRQVKARTAELLLKNTELEEEISERKQAEEALRESEEKYRFLVENANDAIVIAQDETIKFSNPKNEEMTGYSTETLAKIPFINLIHPDDRDMVLDRHKRRLSGEELPATNEFRIINRLSEELWVEVNTVVINWEERPATLNIIRDITSQKKLEAQIFDTQKMEAISTLAGGIAHQFNNALTSVVGNIQLLEMDFADNKTVTEYTEAMKASSHRMVNLTSQLLAYARGGRYQAKTMSLSDFVEDTLPIIKPNIDPSIRLETDLPRDIFSVEADPAQMQMVLSAIVDNSSEAIEGEGRIRIITSNKEIDATFAKNHPELNPGNYVSLTVEDDGKGMDAETLNKIFDPFYTTKFTGRGLGMAAVYGIIRNHNGWITVESELNKGTIIRIYLRAIKAEEIKKEAIVEYATEMPKGEGTILIIEDEEMVMNVIRAVLERLGYRMLEAKTGREAVEIAKTFDGDIDLALLDIKLPDIRGDKVYPLIMKARPNLKVIVCSGYSIDTARGILDAGAQDFIQKPFSVEKLSKKLKEVLEGN